MRITLNNYKKILGENIQSYDWDCISWKQKLSESFIREFEDKLNWTHISYRQKLSEEFIREFKDEVNWYNISWKQKLSESFIREFKDEVYWYNISRCQKLSDSFLGEFKDEVDLDILVINSVFYCGKSNRCISIQKSNPEIINIGCFEGTKEEAIKAVNKKYLGKAKNDYIAKIEECFDF